MNAPMHLFLLPWWLQKFEELSLVKPLLAKAFLKFIVYGHDKVHLLNFNGHDFIQTVPMHRLPDMKVVLPILD